MRFFNREKPAANSQSRILLYYYFLHPALLTIEAYIKFGCMSGTSRRTWDIRWFSSHFPKWLKLVCPSVCLSIRLSIWLSCVQRIGRNFRDIFWYKKKFGKFGTLRTLVLAPKHVSIPTFIKICKKLRLVDWKQETKGNSRKGKLKSV